MGLAKGYQESGVGGESAILAKLPKIEFHRHLEGTYPIESLFKMALKNELDVPKELDEFKRAFQFPKNHKPDFLLFLSKFKKDWYKTIDDVATISYDSVKSFAKEGLHYIELRYNPLHFTELTGLDPKLVSKTIIDSCNAAASEIDLQIQYLHTYNRSVQTASDMLSTYLELQETDLSGVVGIDLAGDEINYPPELFSLFFDKVKLDGQMGIDIHAGEVTDSKNMWVAIDTLHADRIGHGVAAIDDEKIQKYLAKKNIFLAQCITSNFQTGAWVDEKTHPMDRLVKAGVPVSIASDDPTIQDSVLTDDYAKTMKYFGWTIDDLIQSNIDSIQGCFLDDEGKSALEKSYRLAVESFKVKSGVRTA